MAEIMASEKIKFKYRYMVFLYAYLRQIDLSIDRGIWGDWSELRGFYESQIQPAVAAQSLEKNSLFKHGETFHDIILEKSGFWTKCYFFFRCAVLKKAYMTLQETQYCYQLLMRFNGFLQSDINKYIVDIVLLRIEIAQFYSHNILGYRILRKDAYRAMYIECCLMNECIKPVMMKEFSKHVVL